MKPWAVWLLAATVFGRHYGVDWVALGYADPERARRVLFYIAGGLQGAVLFALLWWLLPRGWPRVARAGGAVVCAWGAVEEGQVAWCRLALGVEAAPAAPMWRGLCDVATGFPVSTLTLAAPLALLLLWMTNKGE